MGLPVTDEGPTEWLVDAADPLLTPDRLERIADPSRPDRLTWNTFRILGLWNADAWVPSLVEEACGNESPLVELEWAEASIRFWTSDVLGPEVCDVVIEGPAGHLVIVCTLTAEPPETQLRAAAVAALDGSMAAAGGREAGLIVVGPPGGGELLESALALATDVEVHDAKLLADLLDGAMGASSWDHLGRLALDLAEEGADEGMESVHQLVTEIQTRFPGATL